MAKEKFYIQCDFSQGTGRDKAFIEKRGAVVGNLVEIKPGSGDFWKVDAVSNTGITEDTLKMLHQVYREGYDSIKPRIRATT